MTGSSYARNRRGDRQGTAPRAYRGSRWPAAAASQGTPRTAGKAPEATKVQGCILPTGFRGSAEIFVLDFCAPELQTVRLVLLSHLVCGTLLWKTRKLYHVLEVTLQCPCPLNSPFLVTMDFTCFLSEYMLSWFWSRSVHHWEEQNHWKSCSWLSYEICLRSLRKNSLFENPVRAFDWAPRGMGGALLWPLKHKERGKKQR